MELNIGFCAHLVYIVTRVLASRSAEIDVVSEKAYLILQAARSTCHRWTRDLSQKVQTSTSSGEIDSLRSQLCDTAQTCLATYDVDRGPHLASLLESLADVSTLVECCIILHDNTPVNLSKLERGESCGYAFKCVAAAVYQI